jgi:predicted  nucleic acid-binding Zn-ribbon protein
MGGIKKNGTAMTATGKLIAAMESEEKRLRENELRYAEKIKILSTQLDHDKKSIQLLTEKLELNQARVISCLIKSEELDKLQISYDKLKTNYETLKYEFEMNLSRVSNLEQNLFASNVIDGIIIV